ncbi:MULTISPECIES: HAD family hydrolase [Bacillaceae]|uniref:HAD family hydrolase n=1 Tax=Metabacillus sp. 22489 TaxID=3453928 RepID=UPI000BA70783|nr:haloacid dehalogenase [Bacillus sp. 7586-K]
MSTKAMIFDLDDTLFAEKDYIFSGFLAVDKAVQKKLSVSGFYKIAIELFEEGERKYIFNRALDRLNVNYNNKLIHSLLKTYRTHLPDIQLLNDAKWVIENLHDSVKLGIISDGYIDAQYNKVKALNLKNMFHSIILSDRFGRENWKPSKVPYLHVCMALQVEHKDCIYIGDNLSKDFITAKSLGWKTVYIERRHGMYPNIIVDEEYQAHYKISDLKELSLINEFENLFKKQYVPYSI